MKQIKQRTRRAARTPHLSSIHMRFSLTLTSVCKCVLEVDVWLIVWLFWVEPNLWSQFVFVLVAQGSQKCWSGGVLIISFWYKCFGFESRCFWFLRQMSHDDVERGIAQKACQERIQKIRKSPSAASANRRPTQAIIKTKFRKGTYRNTVCVSYFSTLCSHSHCNAPSLSPNTLVDCCFIFSLRWLSCLHLLLVARCRSSFVVACRCSSSLVVACCRLLSLVVARRHSLSHWLLFAVLHSFFEVVIVPDSIFLRRTLHLPPSRHPSSHRFPPLAAYSVLA